MERHLLNLLLFFNTVFELVVFFMSKQMVNPNLFGVLNLIKLDSEFFDLALQNNPIPPHLGLGLRIAYSIPLFGDD